MNSFCGFELINIGYGVISKFSTTNFQRLLVRSHDLFFQKNILSKFSQINFRKSQKFQVNWISGWKVIKKSFVRGSSRPPQVWLGLKMMKNSFYFRLKKLLSLLRYLHFCPDFLGHIRKRPDEKAKVKDALWCLIKFFGNWKHF